MNLDVVQSRLSAHQSHGNVPEVLDEEALDGIEARTAATSPTVATGETARPRSTTGRCTKRVPVTTFEERRAPDLGTSRGCVRTTV